MNNMKKLLCLLLAAVMVVSMAACQPQNTDSTAGTQGTTGDNGQTATYNVTVQSNGKLPLEGISVEVYEDETMQNLVNVASTNAEGKASLTMPVSDKYAVKLTNVKKGYQVQDFYSFTGGNTVITLASKLIEGESMAGVSLNLGDVMYDFEVTDPDGNTVKLSDMLEEKEMVLLNLFYTTCSPCNAEVPYMQEAYSMYEDKVGIIAITPYATDNNAKVADFIAQYGVTFTMAKVPTSWSTLAVTPGYTDGAYPTTYAIDRYGVICMVEVGGLTSLRPFTSIMEHFTGDDYEQKLITNLDEIVTRIEPNVEPMDPTELGNVLGNGDGSIVYSNESSDKYCWPFVSTEKDGETVIMSSNTGIEGSYSLLSMDVTLQKGQGIGFDYLISSEYGADVFHVIVDDTPIYNISGVDENPTWQACYPWVAPQDGTYKVVISYIKDDSDNEGEDNVFLKNVRIVDAAQIDTPSYIPMEAANSQDGFEFEYVEVFLNENDGYYHVGSVDGPLLLANLMYYSQFNEEDYIYNMALNGKFGDEMLEKITPYASYAANSRMSNYCTVNAELAELLKECVSMVGFEGTDTEWLKLCKYYAAYGTDGAQMEDPIAGLATFSALPAQEGMNEIPYWDGIPIMPRGKMMKFVPTRSGVYRITSHDNGYYEQAFMSAWIFDENHEIIHEAMNDERSFTADNYSSASDITMTYYMEAGQAYYIDIAFWDPYTVGSIPFSITYVGSTLDVFKLCSPGTFTYDSDATGDAIYKIIHGGIDAVLNPADGYYHEDLGRDANGNQVYGSIIYADFIGYGIINTPISGDNGLLAQGAFDFSQTEDDLYILQMMEKYENDREKTEEALLAEWGQDLYNEKVDLLDDVFNGIFHGPSGDESEVIRAYLSKMIASGETQGCVPVDEELARVLQLLMDKFTFEGVEQSWLKLCYYFDYVGA